MYVLIRGIDPTLVVPEQGDEGLGIVRGVGLFVDDHGPLLLLGRDPGELLAKTDLLPGFWSKSGCWFNLIFTASFLLKLTQGICDHIVTILGIFPYMLAYFPIP